MMSLAPDDECSFDVAPGDDGLIRIILNDPSGDQVLSIEMTPDDARWMARRIWTFAGGEK